MRDVSAPRIDRPELTLPEAEAALLSAEYAAASVILEYGSGGSTVLAGEMPGKRVFSVESDPDWAAMMRDWFAQSPPASPVAVIHADIGPTKEWGHPKSHHGWRSYPAYPLGVWELDEIPHPDVVLVDGRFRVGCALATAFRAQRPVVLLFDDYAGRQAYHVIEDYLGTPELTGRMARFEVTPQPVPAERLLQVIQLMQRP